MSKNIMTRREAINLSIYMWDKIIRDYKTHMYYNLEPSSYNLRIGINDFKEAVTDDLLYMHGQSIRADFCYKINCSLCAYDNDNDCRTCPLYDNWGYGDDIASICMRPGSPFKTLIDIKPEHELFIVYCKRMLEILKKG